MKRLKRWMQGETGAEPRVEMMLRWAAVWMLIAIFAVLVFTGDGPAWVMKSRDLTTTEVFAEIWAWVKTSWNEVLPIVVIGMVLALIGTGLRLARGHHEAQGQIGRGIVALIAALFATGIIA